MYLKKKRNKDYEPNRALEKWSNREEENKNESHAKPMNVSTNILK